MRWTKLKQVIEGGFAPSVAGRVHVHVTRYHRAHDAEGRWAILVDGEEIGGLGCMRADREQSELIAQVAAETNLPGWKVQKHADELLRSKARHTLPMFMGVLFEYTGMSVDDALRSSDAVLRSLAFLDRRIGKRRLVLVAAEPLVTDLERRCILLRLQAEGLNPQLRGLTCP